MKWIFASLLALLCSVSLVMGADDGSVIARGVGSTYRAAVNDALNAAIEQHYGITISSSERQNQQDQSSSIRRSGSVKESASGSEGAVWQDTVTGTEQKTSEETSSSDERATQSTDRKVGTTETTDRDIDRSSQGTIKSYEVIEDSFDEASGQHTVKIRAYFADTYTAPAGISPQGRKSSRPRLAVGSLYMKAGSINVRGGVVDTTTWAELYAQELNVMLTQSQKFTVLDRKYDAAIRSELFRLGGANASPADASRIAQQLGTDYLIVASALFCDVPITENVNPYTGQPLPTAPIPTPFVSLTYRVILAPTGEVVWTDTIKLDASEFTTAPNLAEFMSSSAEYAASLVAEGIQSALMPFEVVSIASDGMVVIGEGGKSLSVSEILTVYALGEEVKDSRTGEVLDTVEVPVGMVVVERVTEKLSYARLVNGDLSKIGPGCRVRRDPGYVDSNAPGAMQNARPSVPYPPTQVKGVGTGGGIVVPF